MKTITLVLVVVFLSLMISHVSLGQDVQLRIPAATGAMGSEINISVGISDTTGSGIISADMTIQYDQQALNAVGADVSGTIAGGWLIFTNTTTPGQLSISMAGANALNGSGALVSIRFVVQPTAQAGVAYPISFAGAMLNEGNPGVVTQNGSFSLFGDVSVDITLFSPNGGGRLQGGSVSDIAWSTTGSGIHHIHLLYSTNSGASYQNIAASTPDDGIYQWTTPLIDLSTVRVKLIAENASGNALSDDESDADFTIDSTVPETGITLTGTQCEGDWYSSSVLVTLTGADALSGVKEIKYRINNGGSMVYSSPLTVENSSSVYYHSVDNVGNTEEEQSVQFRIDQTAPETPVVVDDEDCSIDGNQLRASWTSSDPESGITEYQYAIGSAPGSGDVVDWTSAGLTTQVTKTGLSLTPGQMYYFAVKALNGACSWSSVGNSGGISYQLPEIGVLPASMSFSAMAEGDDPDTQTLSITNAGCGILNWSISDDADWLSYTPASGDCTDETDEVTVSVDIAGLIDGIYNATLTISAPDASNAPQSIPVMLNVTEPLPTTLLSPNGGERLRGGSVYDITWSTTGKSIIHLLYSTNSGASYQNIAASTPDDGIYQWTTPLIDLATVRVKLIAENASGNVLSDDESNADFTIDSTVPESGITLTGTQCENDWYNSSVLVTLTGLDVLSGVKETRYKINNGSSKVYASPFTVENSSSVYYHSVDNAGNTEEEQSVQFRIDQTAPETPVVLDDEDCSIDGSRLYASWTSSDPESGITEYQYAIGTTPGLGDVVDWTSAGLTTQVTRTGLSLTPGRTYYFAVKALNGACLWSSVGSSNGILYKLPEMGVWPASLTFSAVVDGNNPTAQTLRINNTGCGIFNWSVSDDADWLSAIPTSGDSTDETDEVTVFVDIAGLTNGTYNATLTISAPDASNAPQSIPVMLNVADPPPTTLLSPNGRKQLQGGSISDITWSTTGRNINHIHLLYSTNSGASYQDIVASTPDDGIYQWTTPLIDLSTVRVKLIAENVSGNALSDDQSDADFTIDSTVPETGITLTGTQCESGWYSSSVLVTLAGMDVLSGVRETRYKINNGGSKVYSSPFTVENSSNVYYHSVDNVGNTEEEQSVQFRIDETAPETPVVVDDGDCSIDGDQLYASWTSSDDPESGITEYQYAIGTTPGLGDVVDWTSAGLTTQVTKTGLSLTPGQMYYFAVKALNDACLWSSVGNSDGILYLLPEIDVWPASMSFSAMAESDDPDTQILSITNTGCGTLNWSVNDDADWLSCTPTVGDCTDETDEVTVSVDIAGLTGGTYNATLTISAPDASNTPQTVPITLNVEARPTHWADLVVTNIDAPPAIKVQAEASWVDVSWTVTNQGNKEAVSVDGRWRDSLYISTDDILDEEDSNLSNHYINEPLPIDSSHTVGAVARITSMSAGRYYFLVETDRDDSVSESNENNNVYASPVDVVSILLPIADFSAEPISGEPPLVVNFTDLSQNEPTDWLWDFGDGETSILQNPVHEYATTGDYAVSLTVTNPDGSHTETKQNYISPREKIDEMPPDTNISLLGAEDKDGWYRTPVQVVLSATDDDSGVSSTRYRMAAGSWQDYSGDFTIDEDGVHTIEYFSEDNAGNQETLKAKTVSLDMTPPKTIITLSGEKGNDDWYVSSIEITFSVEDTPSGIYVTEYGLNGGDWQGYSETIVVDGDGEHTVEFYSMDRAGNREESQSVSFRIDTELPTASMPEFGVKGENDWYVSDVTVGCNALDTISGVKECLIKVDNGAGQPPPIAIGDEGEHELAYYAEDKAGNNTGWQPQAIRLDKTPPEFGDWTHIPPVLSYETGGDFTIQVTIHDAVSGVSGAQLTYGMDGDYTGDGDMSLAEQGNWIFTIREDWELFDGRTLSYKVQALDNAGNSVESDERYVDIGQPEVSVSTKLIDFGTIRVGELAERELAISNMGNAQLDVVNITTDARNVTVSETEFTIQPGDTHSITVSLTPSGVYKIDDYLTIESNAPDSPTTVGLSGRFPQPEITGIEPASGTVEGGTEIVITGWKFVQGAIVEIGGNRAESQVQSPTQITARTPASPASMKVDVLVTNPDAQQARLEDGFMYKKLSIITVSTLDEVQWNSEAIISGKILDPENPDVRFIDAAVTLVFTSPEGIEASSSESLKRTAITDSNGSYSLIFSNLSDETMGKWSVKADWPGNDAYIDAESEAEFEVTRVTPWMAWDEQNPTHLTITDEKNISISGRIEPGTGVVEVVFSIIDPDGSSDSVEMTTDVSGAFTYAQNIDKAGQWNFVSSWDGDDKHDKGVSDRYILQVGSTIGKVIIIQGDGGDNTREGWDPFGSLARYVYGVFRQRRFSYDDIYYLSPESGKDVDAVTSLSNLEDAITGWAASKLNPDLSLYIYLVGHNGSKGLLMKGDEFLTAEKLDSWLDGLDGKCKDITLIVEACYSGTLIENLLGEGRIIMASSQARSLILPGYSFTSFFFHRIVGNQNMRESFELAIEDMLVDEELFGEQMPQLEANGDGAPNSIDDRVIVEGKYIDGDYDSRERLTNPPEIVEVSGDQELPAGETEATIWARVSSMSEVNRVRGVIVPPDYSGCQPEFEYMPDMDFSMVDMEPTDVDTYTGVCEGLDDEGTYVILIYSENADGISQPQPVRITVMGKNAVIPDDKLTVSWGGAKSRFALGQNYPNPFNPETWIPYQLAKETDVAIKIYDSTGLLIRRLDMGRKSSGWYVDRDKAAHWDGRNLWGERVANGVYFYQLEAGDFTAMCKFVITK